jgi:prepilin-type processing-associated H-X9-DG protein
MVFGCGVSTAPPNASTTQPAAHPNVKSLEQLVGELQSDKAQERVAAADALGAMGAEAKSAVPDLIRVLGDENFWAGLAVAEALSSIGEPAAPALAEAMAKGPGMVPVRAGFALRGMGAAARPALPALRAALQGKNARLRDVAAEAIAAIEQGGQPATPAATRRIRSAAVRPPESLHPADGWTGFRGPRRDGLCLETGLLATWPADGLKLLWKSTGLGKGYSSVAMAGGRLFTMGDRKLPGKEAQFVLAFDLTGGKELWAVEVGPPHTDGPRCTPTVDGAVLYALGTEGDLVCLETASGKLRWRKSLVRDFGGQMMSMWKFSESPLVDGEKLICTPGGKDAALVALNKKTGELIWKCKLPDLGPKGKDGAAYSSAVVAEIDRVRQYVQILGRGAVGVDARDGKLLWSYNRIANDVANVPTPIVRDNYVFVTTSYKTGSALLKIVRKQDAFAAEEVYFLDPTQFENHHGGVVLVGDYLYGGHGLNRGQPVCIHLPTGEMAWKSPPLGRGSAAVLYADGHVIFRYDRGEVFWVEANPREFRVQGRFKPVTADGPAWAYPVVDGKRLYLRHGDVLACYDLSAQ